MDLSVKFWTLAAAFLAMLFWAVADFLIQKSTRKIGDLESLALIGIVGSIGLIPLMIKDAHLLFSFSNLLLLLILGIVTFASAIVDFEALKIAKLSTADIIMELELPITILLGYLFLKEGLSGGQLLIVSLIFFGTLLVATESLSHWRIKWEKGVTMAVCAALSMGLANFLTSASSRNISPIMAVWGPWFVFTIFCIVLIIKREGWSPLVQHAKKYKWLVFGMGLVDTAAWVCYSFAVVRQNVGIVTAITESYPAVAIFLAVWINKEKVNWHQYLGAGMALAASAMLAFLL